MFRLHTVDQEGPESDDDEEEEEDHDVRSPSNLRGREEETAFTPLMSQIMSRHNIQGRSENIERKCSRYVSGGGLRKKTAFREHGDGNLTVTQIAGAFPTARPRLCVFMCVSSADTGLCGKIGYQDKGIWWNLL